jgi:F-type H+-transporting ATPase subunit c
MLSLGVAFGLPIAVLSAGIGQGRAAAAALEGMARQPELHAKLQTSLIISLAFIESLVIYALVMFFFLFGQLPPTEALLKAAGAATGAAPH